VGATILPERRDADGTERARLQRRAEYRRELDEQFERKKKTGCKNGVEMLQAWRDLFDSDEEMEEFGLYIQQMREEERARYRD
jgi:hypothetical protein